ncbi:MAG: type VI secretion system baseplate subunit TssE [Phycisphaerales bacterium]
MAELMPKELLQPCLLDRLTDNDPQNSSEGRHERIVSLKQFREAVLRDLRMLLNARRRPPEDPIYGFDHAARSVLNYGIPEIYGHTVSTIEPAELERLIRQTIETFEPRIAPGSLSVRVIIPEKSGAVRSLMFEIAGDLWAHPAPDHLLVETELDIESGHCALRGKTLG